MKVATAMLPVALLVAASGGESGTTETSPVAGDINIEALDTLRFDPADVTVAAGEPVRFVVTNAGSAMHEFVLGNEKAQKTFAEGKDHGGHQGNELPAVTLVPGQTQEVTVTFDEPGEILYACHVNNHYEAGMVGTINVQES
jgi:uncharacterized cupredoxin-like copper-binding protein